MAQVITYTSIPGTNEKDATVLESGTFYAETREGALAQAVARFGVPSDQIDIRQIPDVWNPTDAEMMQVQEERRQILRQQGIDPDKYEEPETTGGGAYG